MPKSYSIVKLNLKYLIVISIILLLKGCCLRNSGHLASGVLRKVLLMDGW